MDDALHLFDEICNNDIFKKTAIMLFLSKIDIFREKIKTSSISTYFPSFKGWFKKKKKKKKKSIMFNIII